MRTLHLDRGPAARAGHSCLPGSRQHGRRDRRRTAHGTLSMLHPPDDPFVTIELDHDPDPPATPTASPRPTPPEQPGPYPRSACRARRDRLPPATITPGYSNAEAQGAISPIRRAGCSRLPGLHSARRPTSYAPTVESVAAHLIEAKQLHTS